MRTACALGLDLGTSGLKAVLVAADGSVVAQASRQYAVASPQPGWAETDPTEWEQAAKSAVAQLLAAAAPNAEVVGVGLDGQMHGAVLVDDAGTPVRPAVLWPDSRASSELIRWRSLEPASLTALANPLAPGMAGPILGWLSAHEPDSVAQATWFLSPKDWVRSRLVDGSLVSDPSDASATLLWNVDCDDWDRDVCKAVGIDPRLLPGLMPSGTVAGTVDANAPQWQLPADVPVSVGCSDVAATILGTPARSGRYTLTVGTGAQVVLPETTPSPQWPIRYHTYRQADSSYFAMAALMNAGLALAHVVRLLETSWDELYRPYDRTRAVPGFLPFFSGERLPVPIPASAGGWFDVGLASSRGDLLAAALEGVVFAIRRALEPFPDADDDVIDLTGGGSRSPVLTQLLADVLGRPLRRVERLDATALGAAWLGWQVSGHPAPTRRDAESVVVDPAVRGAAADALDQRYARFVERADQLGDWS